MTRTIESLSIAREETPDVCTLTLAGSVTLTTHDGLEVLLEGLAASGPPSTVVLLEQVPFIDSAGIGMFVSARKSFEENGRRLLLRRVPERIASVFRLLRLYETLVAES